MRASSPLPVRRSRRAVASRWRQAGSRRLSLRCSYGGVTSNWRRPLSARFRRQHSVRELAIGDSVPGAISYVITYDALLCDQVRRRPISAAGDGPESRTLPHQERSPRHPGLKQVINLFQETRRTARNVSSDFVTVLPKLLLIM
jgi:hypothetical protein